MSSQPVHIERKVITGSLVALAAGAGFAVLNGLAGSPLLTALPAWAQALAAVLIPPAISFLAQYATPHTVRADIVPAVPAAGPDDLLDVAPDAGQIGVVEVCVVFVAVVVLLVLVGVLHFH